MANKDGELIFLIVSETKHIRNPNRFNRLSIFEKKQWLKDERKVISNHIENQIILNRAWAKDEFEKLSRLKSVDWASYHQVYEISFYKMRVAGGKITKKDLIKYHCSDIPEQDPEG